MPRQKRNEDRKRRDKNEKSVERGNEKKKKKKKRARRKEKSSSRLERERERVSVCENECEKDQRIRAPWSACCAPARTGECPLRAAPVSCSFALPRRCPSSQRQPSPPGPSASPCRHHSLRIEPTMHCSHLLLDSRPRCSRTREQHSREAADSLSLSLSLSCALKRCSQQRSIDQGRSSRSPSIACWVPLVVWKRLLLLLLLLLLVCWWNLLLELQNSQSILLLLDGGVHLIHGLERRHLVLHQHLRACHAE